MSIWLLNDDYTALHFAVSSNKDYGYSPLHKACIQGDVGEVMRLVRVDDHLINIQNNVGYTPLYYACRLSHSDIVKTLMLEGADKTITNDFWLIPAQLAEMRRHRELLKFLNRVILWNEMQTNNFTTFSVCFLVMLTLQLMPLMLKIKQSSKNNTQMYYITKFDKILLFICDVCSLTVV